jgi:hypothetical protein
MREEILRRREPFRALGETPVHRCLYVTRRGRVVHAAHQLVPKENRIPPRLTIRPPADMATEIVPPLHKHLATQARAPAPACAPTEAPRIPRMFQIFGVENPRAKVRRENVCHREARVIQYCLIRVDGNAVRILDDDGLRYRVSDPAEYSLVLEQLRFCLFERVDVRAGYSNGYRVGVRGRPLPGLQPPPRRPYRRRHAACVEWISANCDVCVWGGIWAVGDARRCRRLLGPSCIAELSFRTRSTTLG